MSNEVSSKASIPSDDYRKRTQAEMQRRFVICNLEELNQKKD